VLEQGDDLVLLRRKFLAQRRCERTLGSTNSKLPMLDPQLDPLLCELEQPLIKAHEEIRAVRPTHKIVQNICGPDGTKSSIKA
jgi:hypothetical protein